MPAPGGSADDDAARAHDGARRPRAAQADRRQGRPGLLRPRAGVREAAAHRRGNERVDRMSEPFTPPGESFTPPSEPVTFWYGCNVLRHGDIIHSCLDILRALGFEPSPVGGP